MTWIEGPRSVPAVEGPEAGSLEARASLVFKIMGVIGLAGIILSLLPDSFPNSTLLTVAFNWAAGVISVLYLIEARGIDRSRPWAVAAARPLLALLGAWGAYTVIAGVAQGFLRLPFELVMVAWAFLGSPGVVPRPQLTGRGLALLGAAIPLLLTMSFGHLVFGWGGVLDVDEHDLVASLDVDCGDPAAGPPEEIAVSFDWSWSASTPLPNEVDTVFVGWSGDDAEGRPLYVLGDTAETDAAIRSGQRGALGQALVAEARGTSSAGFQWAVDLSRRGYQPGHVGLALMRAQDDPPGTPSLTVTASYIHLGLWRVEAPAVTCTW
jgi:hypothetical protein